MQLLHIKEEECPVCKVPVVLESRKNRHTNGHWNEMKEFQCGAVICWSPNYMAVDSDACIVCPNEIIEIEKREKRKLAKEKLLIYIQKLKVDDSFKNSLLSSIRCKNIDW